MKINCFLFLIIVHFFLSCNNFKENKYLDNPEENIQTFSESYLINLKNELITKNNDSINREKLLKIAYKFEQLQLYENSSKTLHRVINLAKKANHNYHRAKAYRYLGDLNESKQTLDSAYYYYDKAEKLYKTDSSDKLDLARIAMYKAGILYDLGFNGESEIEIVKALETFSESSHPRFVYEANLLMALNLKELKEYNDALKYYNKIPNLIEEMGKDKSVATCWLAYYNNMGSYYIEIREHNLAKDYLEKGLALKYVSDYPKSHAMLLNNYAKTYINNNDFSVNVDSILNKSLQIRQNINHNFGIIASKISIAEYKLKIKDTLQSIQNMEKAYLLASSEKSNFDVLRTLKFLSEIDRSNTNIYSQKYILIKDSLNNQDKQIRNKFARIAYETDRVEKVNLNLIRRVSFLIALTLLVFLLAISILFVYKLRLKNRELLHREQELRNVKLIQDLLLKQQNSSEEIRNKERERIAKDLHDAVINRIFTTRINLEELEIEPTEKKKKLVNELKKTEHQIREISHNMHQSLFSQQQDFSLVIENLILEQRNNFKTTFQCSIDTTVNWNLISIQFKTQIYLIVQELLQNVNKHSQAKKCVVFFIKKEDKIIIRVHDDGIGFDVINVKNGLGFKNIKHRIKLLNASIKHSVKNGFTTIVVEIPI